MAGPQKTDLFVSMASTLTLALLALFSSCTGVDGALAWGSFLGADWAIGEGEGGMHYLFCSAQFTGKCHCLHLLFQTQNI